MRRRVYHRFCWPMPPSGRFAIGPSSRLETPFFNRNKAYSSNVETDLMDFKDLGLDNDIDRTNVDVDNQVQLFSGNVHPSCRGV
ncbi:hypothetical protein ACQKWADRAFT_267427 [Trichoderma austrokoningii]